MLDEVAVLGREYDSLEKRARTLRDKIWPTDGPSGKAAKQVGIVERLRGERELENLDSKMEEIRGKLQGLIQVGL